MKNKLVQTYLWKSVQGTGRRLDNHIYKIWRDRYNTKHKSSPLYKISKNLTLGNIRQAYHSPLTKPEHRAILLFSLFESTNWVSRIHGGTKHTKLAVATKLDILPIKDKSGNFYLKAFDQNSKSVRLSNSVTKELMYRHVKAPVSPRYMRAITTGSIKQQKVAYWAKEFNTCLLNLADVLINTVVVTDPFNRFGSPPFDDEEEITPETPETGNVDDKRDHVLRNYEKNLLNIMTQFNNYVPVANRLGIDTSGISGRLSSLHSQIQSYNELEYHRDDLLDLHHQMAVETVGMIHSITKGVEQIDMNDPQLNNVVKSTVVQKFTPLEWRAEFHRTNADKASGIIENRVERMFKKKVWELSS